MEELEDWMYLSKFRVMFIQEEVKILSLVNKDQKQFFLAR